MSLTTQTTSYNAKQLNSSKRKQLALDSMNESLSITDLANENNVSRKFIYQQQNKAINAVNDTFEPTAKKNEKVLFYLPVTFSWLCQLILCLVLHCRANHRGIQKLLRDAFDHELSYGSVCNIVNDAKEKAKVINKNQTLENIKLAAQDEIFHYNKPVLTGVDIPSLYCYLLSSEDHRDFNTWGTHLLDLKKQGLNPDRVFGDDASSIQAAHRYVYPKTPYDIDNFHIIRDMMEMRRYYRNSLKSAITNRKTLEDKVNKTLLTEKFETYHEQLECAIMKEKEIKELSQSIDTLVSWMQHDVLNMPGLAPALRYELFDFVSYELTQLAQKHPHRIKAVCTSIHSAVRQQGLH